MINLFTFASNDASICYLGTIFGAMNGVIPLSTVNCSGMATGGSISLLGTMFQYFNSVVLTVGALVIVYITVVGVLQTAQEGEFMGKHWNKLWTPIRIVLGVAALVPTGSGYSGLQILMMWVIVQGVGAADTLWNTAFSYINVTGSPYAQVSIPGVGVNTTMTTMFQGLVCDASARLKYQILTKEYPQGGIIVMNMHQMIRVFVVVNLPLALQPQ